MFIAPTYSPSTQAPLGAKYKPIDCAPKGAENFLEDYGFYKHCAPDGAPATRCGIGRRVEMCANYSINLNTYFSSKPISNFLNRDMYSLLND
jgi:hypothetical protein